MGLSGMAHYWDQHIWLVGWFGCFSHSCECLLDHYAETDSLGATHTPSTHTVHIAITLLTLTHSNTNVQTNSHPSSNKNTKAVTSSQTDSYRGQRTRYRKERTLRGNLASQTDSVIELFILYSFCTILIKKEQIEKWNFYFISQSSRWGQLYRSYRVNMALRYLIVGLPNSFCK